MGKISQYNMFITLSMANITKQLLYIYPGHSKVVLMVILFLSLSLSHHIS